MLVLSNLVEQFCYKVLLNVMFFFIANIYSILYWLEFKMTLEEQQTATFNKDYIKIHLQILRHSNFQTEYLYWSALNIIITHVLNLLIEITTAYLELKGKGFSRNTFVSPSPPMWGWGAQFAGIRNSIDITGNVGLRKAVLFSIYMRFWLIFENLW